MPTILVAGATGALGNAVVRELHNRSLPLRVLVRDRSRATSLIPFTYDIATADASAPHTLAGVCTGVDVVVSALGRSVSLNDRSRASYRDINYAGNKHLLDEAKRSGVKKFIYVSAFGADRLTHLAYFRAHSDFSEALRTSGIDYAIVQPTAFFSAFDDILVEARRGRIACPGKGTCRTNPIHPDDLAAVCANAINSDAREIPVGGPNTHTRYEILEMAARAVGRPGRVPRIPLRLVKSAVPVLRFINRNMYDTLAFYMEVASNDVLAPSAGSRTLENYFAERAAALFPGTIGNRM